MHNKKSVTESAFENNIVLLNCPWQQTSCLTKN